MPRTQKAITLQTEISAGEISKRIYTVRGCQVMLDNDLAEIYNVETRMVKRAVRRNPERFPSDFQFEMTDDELALLRCQIGISNVENFSNGCARPSLISQNGISKFENGSDDCGERLRSQFGTSNVENFSEGHSRPCLISQNGISNLETPQGRGGSRYTPMAFTELGVAMLSTVLRSQKAIQVNIGIMRVFVELRRETNSRLDLAPKLDSLENLFKQRFDRLEAQFQTQPAGAFSLPSLHPKRDPVGMIQNTVARHFGLNGEDLKSALRTQAISLPRQIAIYLVRKHLCMGFSEIGQHFGQRDHTTIMHAYRKILADSEVNTMIRTAINSLQNEIQPLLS